MELSEFDYHLPEERIAQEPLPERDASRLLVLERRSGELAHHLFRDLPGLLEPDDLVVFNDVKVIPARIYGAKERTGGKVECLLLEKRDCDRQSELWDCMAKGAGRLRKGSVIQFDEGVRGVVEGKGKGDRVPIRFSVSGPTFRDWLEHRGHVPLPPYIRRVDRPEDRKRYQTVYARTDGAVAAPTAGLHFTTRVLNDIKERGIEQATVTLHIGAGTFRPIRVQRIANHRMDPEMTEVSPDAAGRISKAHNQGRRIVAVGTSVVRTLEGRATRDAGGELAVLSGRVPVSLFITPGYEFQVVSGLVTNFHLPCSTLLLLVSALAGRETIIHAYEEALREGYRFYSYGDAMLIL